MNVPSPHTLATAQRGADAKKFRTQPRHAGLKKSHLFVCLALSIVGAPHHRSRSGRGRSLVWCTQQAGFLFMHSLQGRTTPRAASYVKDPGRCAGDDSDQLPLAGEVRVRVRPESPGSRPHSNGCKLSEKICVLRLQVFSLLSGQFYSH